jgi:uncharacterized protein (DUF1330 family)
MAAVYFVAVHNVTDPEQLKQYMGAVGSLGAGEVIAADENATTFEGDPRSRMVILRFPSKEAALEWYNSEDYQTALPLRLNSISDNWAGTVTAFDPSPS